MDTEATEQAVEAADTAVDESIRHAAGQHDQKSHGGGGSSSGGESSGGGGGGGSTGPHGTQAPEGFKFIRASEVAGNRQSEKEFVDAFKDPAKGAAEYAKAKKGWDDQDADPMSPTVLTDGKGFTVSIGPDSGLGSGAEREKVAVQLAEGRRAMVEKDGNGPGVDRDSYAPSGFERTYVVKAEVDTSDLGRFQGREPAVMRVDRVNSRSRDRKTGEWKKEKQVVTISGKALKNRTQAEINTAMVMSTRFSANTKGPVAVMSDSQAFGERADATLLEGAMDIRSDGPVLESVNEPDPNQSVRSTTADADLEAAVEEAFAGDDKVTGYDGDGWFVRSYTLDDIRVAKTTDGRTVEAYAAVFNSRTEVRDKDGHYYEEIDPKAFNRAINRPPFHPMVIYNHGLDLFGRPASGANTVPLGEALEIKADGRGVFTRSRYHSGAFADEVLQAVKDGVITGQSFRGSFTRSKPALRRGQTFGRRDDGDLTVVRREEVYPLVEFGPTPTPYYKDAAILAVRSQRLRNLAGLLLSDSTPAQEAPDVDVVDEAVTEALGEEVGRSAPSRLQVLSFHRVRAEARRKGLL